MIHQKVIIESILSKRKNNNLRDMDAIQDVMDTYAVGSVERKN